MRECTLGDVAVERSETCKTEKERFPIVGLEHIIPEQVTLTEWSTSDETTFTKMFHEKDVLFGRRRAYLKKAAVAPFDGICSGDITVIVAKEEVLCSDLLPFLVQNDALFEYAVKMSAGGLSPRVKWKDLKEFPIVLPDMAKQEELAELLWSIEHTKRAYRELLQQTDELVKSQFIEMFGDQKTNPLGLISKTLGETCEFYSGTGFPNDYQGNSDGMYPFYKVGDISRNVQAGNNHLTDCDNYINDDVLKIIKGSLIPKGTVVFAKIGEALRLNRRAITTCDCLIDNNAMGIKPKDELTLEYFFQYMKLLDMGEYAGATAMPSVRKSTLEGVHILVPNMDMQIRFSEMLKQSDKSKFELQKSLDELTALQKKIIEQNLM